MTRLTLAVVALLLALTGCATTNSSAPQEDPQRISSPADKPKANADQAQALEAAESYLSFSYMSADGLRKQLAFDKHPKGAIAYAVKNVDADWDAEAEEAVQSYMDSGMGLSKQGVREQLLFEGFTKTQAARAIERTWGKN